MPTHELQFRNATAADAEGMARVLEVFSPEPKAEAQQELHLKQLRESAHEWRIGVQAGEIVGAAHASPSEVWFGGSRIKWADIGEVSVLASRQGEGIGSLVMEDMVGWLQRSGVGLSRLGGLLRFYSRFGYEPFPRCYVEFPVSDFIRAGASKVAFSTLLEPAFDTGGQVRRFDAVRDIPQGWQVMDDFTRHRTGCRVFEHPTCIPDSIHDAMVYENGGQVRGVMHFREFDTDMSPFEASLMIYHLWYQPDCPAALDALVKHVLKRAHEKKASRATAFIPSYDDVAQDLQRIGVSYTLCETMGAVAGNMVRVTDLRALLEQIQPELQHRVAHLRPNIDITLDTGDQQAALHITPGRVEVCEANGEGRHIRLSHADLGRAILGILPTVWPRLIDQTDEVWPVVNMLFPPVRGGYCS